VEKAIISYKKQRGEVYFEPNRVSESQIVAKVNEIGFKATVLGRKNPDVRSLHDIDTPPKRHK
jgi:hypothetical protein